MFSHGVSFGKMTRRGMVTATAGALATAVVGVPGSSRATADSSETGGRVVTRGRIKQSVCAWCYAKSMSLDTLARHTVGMGLRAIELVEPEGWPTLKKHGLTCPMVFSHGWIKGLNNKENHDECIGTLRKRIDLCAEAGFPNVITFSGYANGIPSDVGLENMIVGLKKVIGHAEKQKVNICLEALNSRVNVDMKGHPDYMCDKVEWAAEVCRRLSSPRMKILFDIYHVQIMEGDVITRIRKYRDYIGHYHVAGVPGRHEVDDNQELNYRGIMKAIVETGFQGYVGQEFMPTRDPIQSLRGSVKVCDV